MKLSEQAVAIATTFTLAALLASITPAQAQAQPQQGQQTPDSVVAVVADAMSLPYVPPDQRPVFGTFWEVRSSLPCLTAPLPFPPFDTNAPVYSIGDPIVGGQFLVDETAGQVISQEAQSSRRALRSMTTASIVQAQAEELQTFVAGVQARQAYALARANGQTPDGPPPIPGDGGGGGTNDSGGGTTFDAKFYTTNDLWLEIVTWTNATGVFVVHPPEAEATTGVYDLFMTTNLSPNVPGLNLTNWAWLLRTDPGETNLIVPDLWADQAYFMLGRTNDTDGDGMSDAYEHLVSHTSPTNQDGPIITLQPLSQTVYSGDTVTFTVAAEGAQPLAYQWFLNASALPGETNTSLTLANVQTSQGGDYSVQVTSPLSLSVLSSNATLSVPLSEYGDFIWLIGPRQDFTFRNGVTYLVNSRVELYGVTTIQGGCVIKPDWYYTNSTVVVMGTLLCKTDDPNLPAFFTSVDDDSLGQMIDISTGYPETAANGCPYLDLSAAQVSSSGLSNLRVWYADQGITTPDASKRLDLWHCQFLECNAPIQAGQGAAAGFHNVLFGACTTAVAAPTNFAGIAAEQITAEVSTLWTAPTPPAWLRLTNSIITGGIASGPALVTDHVAISPAGPIFQTNGSANYYLANASLRAAGTPNISARLQTELRQKTTRPPLAFPQQMQATGELTLSQQAGRYTGGAPDYGYYYQALDYTVAWMKLRGKITVLPGTSIGFRQEPVPGTYYTTAYGFDLKEGSTFISRGTPTKPITLVDVQFVQEQPTTPCLLLFAPDFTPPDLSGTDDAPPSLDFRFSNFYTVRGNYVLWSGVSEQGWYSEASLDSAMYWSMQDCNIRGGNITIGLPDWYWMPWDYLYGDGSVSWVNNLFDQVGIFLDPTYYPNGYNDLGLNVDMSFSANNNLFRGGGWFHLEPIPASAGNWTFTDNLFEKVHFVQNVDMPLDFGHNAYWPLTPFELSAWGWGTNRLVAATNGAGAGEQLLDLVPPYQSGPLGDYYLPITTPLYHAGSRLATDAGLFHYTTRVDQTKEAAGNMVNIGLHYVATAAQGSSTPKDSDGDGIPDYLENWHGDGDYSIHADTETDWTHAFTVTGVYDPTNSVYDDIDLSGNGLVGRVKKALGQNPFAAANPLTLTQVITGEEPDFATFEVPISYDVLTNSGDALSLHMNGVEVTLSETTRAANGNSLLSFNIAYDPMGQHFLSSQFRLNSDPDTPHPVMTGNGELLPFYSSNSVQFFEAGSMFDDSGAYVDAKLFANSADYQIDLYDTATTPPTLIRTITNSTSTGFIEEDWDGMLADGITPFTNSEVQAVFTVAYANSPGNVSANKPKKYLTKAQGSLSEGGVNMDFVYFRSPTNDAWEAEFTKGGAVWSGMQGAVNALIKPDMGYPVYYSYFNRYLPDPHGEYPGYITKRSRATNDPVNLPTILDTLLPDLTNGLTKQLYMYGHGTNGWMGNYNNSAYISANDVSSRLKNLFTKKKGLMAHNPYRFVWLDGCATASGKDWRRAFGIYPIGKGAQQQAARNRSGPQAYVGWESVHGGGLNRADHTSSDVDLVKGYTATLSKFYSLWMQGFRVRQCIDQTAAVTAGQWPLPVPQNTNFTNTINGTTYQFKNMSTSRIFIIGFPGLQVDRTDHNFDGDKKYAAPASVE